MVRNFIAVPTKSGALPNERDCIRFIMLCRGKRANPFEGDCFLIGYDTQNGPSFSMVCGMELFLKRAEKSEDYDGGESGVIIKNDSGITERQGSLVLDGESLVGGWAKVYRKNHSKPEYKSVAFKTYNTGRSRWEKDPGGMIEKVAKSQALRAAYPTALGGLYTQEEMERVTQAGDGNFVVREPVAMPKLLDEPAAVDQAAKPAPADTPASADGNKPSAPARDGLLAEAKRLAGVAPKGALKRALASVGLATADDLNSATEAQLADFAAVITEN
jgi:phage recombination protein Bet